MASDRSKRLVPGGVFEPGFEAVRDAFAENFSERGEVGACFSAYWRGRNVVDLWGGVADRDSGRPWNEDTLTVIFSGTKGLVAVCLLILIERGKLDLDARVVRYWPEFGRCHKEGTLVRHLVSHQAGLPGVRHELTNDEILDPHDMARRLEREEPFWPPGERLAYHPVTFGWLCGELIRRIDGRTVGRFFREEVAGPLGLQAWIGLPPDLEAGVSTLCVGSDWGTSKEHQVPESDRLAQWVFNNPSDRHNEPLPHNRREFHRAELAGNGAIVTARAMSRLYGCLACGGEIDGIRLLSPHTIDMAGECIASGPDALIATQRAFGVGFELQTSLMTLGPPENAFGHTGMGGSTHGAWPNEHVGFSYTMNELRDSEPDPRGERLLEALYVVVQQDKHRVDVGDDHQLTLAEDET